MRKYETLSVASIEEIAVKLNNSNKKDIKIEFVERVQSHHPISVLYSYEYENIKRLPKKSDLPISGA